MRERDQGGGQDTEHEASGTRHEEQVTLPVPKEPSPTELQPYIEEQEGRAIGIDTRWEILPELKQLPTDEWVNQISALYPDVVTPDAIHQDLLTLDQIGNNAVKESKWSKVGAGGLVLIIGSVITAAITKLPAAIFITGSAAGLITTVVGSINSSSARRTIDQLVSQWNNRGENWLHQQRDRLFGSKSLNERKR